MVDAFIEWLPSAISRCRFRFCFRLWLNPHELLQNAEFDLLITADPITLKGIEYFPIFEYESRLVLSHTHPLVRAENITVQDLAEETLITYPVDKHRLDIMAKLVYSSEYST